VLSTASGVNCYLNSKKTLRETQTLRVRAGCLDTARLPARYNARPPQSGPITIRCAAKLSMQCNHMYYLAQSLHSIVYVLENFRRTFGNLVAPPIDIATNRLVAKHVYSSNRY